MLDPWAVSNEATPSTHEQLSALFAVRGGGGEATSEDYDQGRTAQCRIIYTCHPATVSHYCTYSIQSTVQAQSSATDA